MCNAIKKCAPLLLAVLALASCHKADPDKKAAEELLAQVEQAMQAENYDLALALMDSIDHAYPSQIDARRQVTSMRPGAIEQSTLLQIVKADSIIAFTQAELNGLEPMFKHVPGGELEGYYVAASAYDPDFNRKTGFEARVNDADGRFYMVAEVQGKTPGIQAISLAADDGMCVCEAIPAASERRMAVEGSEIASFLPEEVADLGQWASEHVVTDATIVTSGQPIPVKLTPGRAAGIGEAWRLSSLMMKLKAATDLRRKLEHQLNIARQQSAKTMANDE